ncbi:MAG: hypothetical protein JWN19_3486 [Arthrobacter sp.]|nr:hypothetical protein [Arthrobacter sp.]
MPGDDRVLCEEPGERLDVSIADGLLGDDAPHGAADQAAERESARVVQPDNEVCPGDHQVPPHAISAVQDPLVLDGYTLRCFSLLFDAGLLPAGKPADVVVGRVLRESCGLRVCPGGRGFPAARDTVEDDARGTGRGLLDGCLHQPASGIAGSCGRMCRMRSARQVVTLTPARQAQGAVGPCQAGASLLRICGRSSDREEKSSRVHVRLGRSGQFHICLTLNNPTSERCRDVSCRLFPRGHMSATRRGTRGKL